MSQTAVSVWLLLAGLVFVLQLMELLDTLLAGSSARLLAREDLLPRLACLWRTLCNVIVSIVMPPDRKHSASAQPEYSDWRPLAEAVHCPHRV